MSTSSLVRLSGLAGLIGGSLWIVVAIAFSAFLAGKPESVTALTGTWSIINGIDLFLGSIFVSLALIGLYARQAREIGGYGLVAFLVAFLGMALFFGFRWGNMFIVPDVAKGAPVFLDAVQENLGGTIAIGYILTFTIFSVGWLFFGIVSLRAGLLPRVPVLLLIVGGGLMFTAFILPFPIPVLFFGIGLAWLGYTIWADKTQISL